MALGVWGKTLSFHDLKKCLASMPSSMVSVGDPWDT